MDPANVREALKEAALDIQEGADFLMVKPALPYLDVIRAVHERFPDHPLVAYNVSGEFAMLKAAAANGWIDERAAALEVLTGIRRGGSGPDHYVSCERGGAMADGSVTTEASLVADKGRSKTGETLYSNRRLFVQLLAYGGCADSSAVMAALDEAGAPAVLYEDLNDPQGVALLSFHEDPDFFLDTVRPLVGTEPFRALVPKPEYTMFGRTYSMGWEPDLTKRSSSARGSASGRVAALGGMVPPAALGQLRAAG